MAALPAFELPTVARDDDGFGPPRKGLVTSEITEMIYAPYNKTDKFGRCADWLGDERDGHGRGTLSDPGRTRRTEGRGFRPSARAGPAPAAGPSSLFESGGIRRVIALVAPRPRPKGRAATWIT